MDNKKGKGINVSTLRQVWSVVEQTHTNVLLRLNDADLVKQLLGELDRLIVLSGEETSSVSAYLYSRTALIRDLAQARLA
ncbi:MAG: hypothetical protein KME49_10505 [Brasilonema octagenarum HA4186-MV1]|jgi:hypothetical protein|uniref:Uncharacterized protein n=2 Tax=Brasilonema TaxID=383614 RepID=A0A856MJN0_9CYAN|nr:MULTISPECIES: hypothetical protein [Brasilonema]MBW4625913.1 hypothetical protein [Brasilonema octagenarum HA4186-MV1]NMF65769.1 hypothetical protein [Brasilonema octagenarum UFV-OR1]QDL11585.1 hypothetical protein DP114_30085 [Brasilonema sennae CENA114]QDL17963.1 hypothetical protein DP113_30240 [Brasilonema octagenarum UFV-E1]